MRQFRQLDLERGSAEQKKHVPEQFEVNRAHCMDSGAAGIEFGLLLLDAGTHMLDDRHILAAQAAQLKHLLCQIAPANMHGPVRFDSQLANASGYRGSQDLLALPHHALPQH